MYLPSDILGGKKMEKFKSTAQNFKAQLVEPSKGRTIDIRITENNDTAADMCMDLLELYAQSMEKFGARYEVGEREIRLIFEDAWMAENIRSDWREKMRQVI